MVWPLIASAALTAGASLFGANKAADAQKKAARLQARATAQAREDLAPYRGAGENALKQYLDALGVNGPAAQSAYFSSFQDDPYLGNILSAGISGIENSAAARGTLYGGNTLAAISDYSGQLRKSAYDTRLGQLGGLVDTGRTAAAGAASAAQTGAQAQGGLLSQAGQYQGAGYINAANAVAGGLENFYTDRRFRAGRAVGLNPTVNNTYRFF